jgi:hypothetical protein
VFELRIAVGITAAFQGLAVHLPTVFQQTQQFGNAARNRGKTPGIAEFFAWSGAIRYDSSYV